MAVNLGMDVGSVSVKAAAILPRLEAAGLLERCEPGLLRAVAVPAGAEVAIIVTQPRRTRGRPLEVAREVLDELLRYIPAEQVAGLTLTGTGSGLVTRALGAPTCNEFQAAARAVDLLHPAVRTVFEIGGESSRYIRLEPDPASGALGILDYSTNGDCAAGTGGFIDQQAKRLKYAVEDIGAIVDEAERAAQIAGRCSVFAKSDMIHAQQKGFLPAEVLRGLCNAVATNYRSAVVKGRRLQPPVALLGGVSANTAVVRGLREAFELEESQLFVPEAADSFGAIGAALAARAAQPNGALGPRAEARDSGARAEARDSGARAEATDSGARAEARDGEQVSWLPSQPKLCDSPQHGAERPAAELRPAHDAASAPLTCTTCPGGCGRAGGSPPTDARAQLARLTAASRTETGDFPRMQPLTLERVRLLRDQVRPFRF
ncbi:MAG: BadF/BadG/BcrA/BcrD ATPase family protein, partial [Planctomycetota bacterium]